ncbi:unnamed protein product [Prorocentrum cordatum]|uniref:Subtilisin n=1 Tax=Prorocentrum cordatum TaxID=2364126 RepID=A0ABN9Y226_9DINO|nr:unnamed protein product [Polarella glacialis]
MLRVAASVSATCALLRVAVSADEATAGDQCSMPGCASSEQVSMLQTARARQEEGRSLQAHSASDAAKLPRSRGSGNASDAAKLPRSRGSGNVSDSARLFRSRGSGARGASGRWDGQTSLTEALNAQIAASPGWGTFRGGGKGILVRAPDFFNDVSKKPTVLPATLWSNDIFAPSGVYPRTDPQCPMNGDDGYGGNPADCSQPGWCNDYSDRNIAKMAYVVGSSMGDMFLDYDNFQDDDWGWGVFYATDSNAVDKRCLYVEAGFTVESPLRFFFFRCLFHFFAEGGGESTSGPNRLRLLVLCWLWPGVGL